MVSHIFMLLLLASVCSFTHSKKEVNSIQIQYNDTENGTFIVVGKNQTIKLDQYLDLQELEGLIKELERNYSDIVRAIPLSKPSAADNTTIWAVQISHNAQKKRELLKPMFKFVANIDGDDAVGYALMTSLIQYLVYSDGVDPRVTNLLNTTDIWVIPTVNPDGFRISKEGCDHDVFEGKTNGRGVYLDKDFPWYQNYNSPWFMEEQHMLGWNIPSEHADLVHIHWRNYPAPENYWHFILAAVYFCLMLLSTSGNGIVLYLFMTTKSLKTPSNLFIFNQALLDLCMMVDMPMLVVNSFYQRIIGWEVGCDIYGLFGSIAGFGSAMNNAVIAYDRYRTIAFPIDGRLSMGKAFVLMCFVWFWALPFSLSPMKSIDVFGKYVPEGFLTTCSFDYLTDDDHTRYFVGVIFVWAYVIPLLLIVFFYIQLLGHVRGHERMLKEQAKKMNVKSLVSNQDKEKSAEIRIAKVAILIFCLFLISWTPYATIALTGCFGNRNVITPMMGMIPAVAAKIVSCIDPWIYAINHPRFRAELAKRCPCLITDEKSSSSDAASTGTHATAATEETVS